MQCGFEITRVGANAWLPTFVYACTCASALRNPSFHPATRPTQRRIQIYRGGAVPVREFPVSDWTELLGSARCSVAPGHSPRAALRYSLLHRGGASVSARGRLARVDASVSASAHLGLSEGDASVSARGRFAVNTATKSVDAVCAFLRTGFPHESN